MERSNRRAFCAAAPLALAAAPAAAQGVAAAQAGRVTAEAFGARGDGRADDAPAIQSAINALGAQGGVLLLGARTYRLGRGITIDPTRISISGARAVLDGRGLPDGSSLLTITAPAGAPQYDHAPQFVEGLILRGRGARTPTRGITCATATPALSSRIALRNCVVAGFGTGIDFGARTYLCQGYSLQVQGCGTGLAFTSGDDAGECLSFHGCSIFNSDVAVANRHGASLAFHGCAFDYCRQWFVGSGLNQFFGCWFEKQRPEAAEDIPFDLVAGDLILHSGGIQVSGIGFAQGSRNSHMFMARDRLSRIVIRDCFAWNWRSASGVLAGGEGSIAIDGLAGQGNRHIPAILKDDRRHNVFGDAGRFATEELLLPCWIAGAGTVRAGPHAIRWEAGGQAFARGEAALTTTRPRNGPRCLRIAKGIGPGTDFAFHAAAPIRPGQGFGAALWYRVEGPGPLGPLWFQIFWARHLATDTHGAMRFGETELWGEVQTPDAGAQLAEWQEVRFNSRSLDQTSAASQEAPAWATHVLISISMVGAGAGTALFLDDVGGWLM